MLFFRWFSLKTPTNPPSLNPIPKQKLLSRTWAAALSPPESRRSFHHALASERFQKFCSRMTFVYKGKKLDASYYVCNVGMSFWKHHLKKAQKRMRICRWWCLCSKPLHDDVVVCEFIEQPPKISCCRAPHWKVDYVQYCGLSFVRLLAIMRSSATTLQSPNCNIACFQRKFEGSSEYSHTMSQVSD